MLPADWWRWENSHRPSILGRKIALRATFWPTFERRISTTEDVATGTRQSTCSSSTHDESSWVSKNVVIVVINATNSGYSRSSNASILHQIERKIRILLTAKVPATAPIEASISSQQGFEQELLLIWCQGIEFGIRVPFFEHNRIVLHS